MKALKSDPRNKIGTLKRANGSFTMTGQKAVILLLETHFPDSIEVDNCPEEWGQPDLEPNRVNRDLLQWTVNQTKLKWAINSFDPYKSAGSDLLIPAFLQQGTDVLSSLLCSIFRACLALGHIPTTWRKARMTFIPKSGKPTYTEAKAYCRICLSSFLLKTLEKLVGRQIRDDVLGRNPLHINQHAYQLGKSTDTALYSVVSTIEKVLQT
jgi:hypothetical protein